MLIKMIRYGCYTGIPKIEMARWHLSQNIKEALGVISLGIGLDWRLIYRSYQLIGGI